MNRLAKSKRLVVKIGSALLVDEATGRIRRDWLDALADDVAALRAELDAYGHGLTDKPEIVGLNKSDAILAEELPAKAAALQEAAQAPVMTLSGATGAGVAEVLRALKTHVLEARARRASAKEAGA